MTTQEAESRANSPDSRSRLRWLLIGWLVAGTLDIAYACAFSYARSGTARARVLQYVASGALGPASFRGGAGTAMAPTWL